MAKYHPTLTVEKWASYPKHFQILSIAAEFARAKGAIGKQDIIETKKSYLRAIELLDLTIGDSTKWQHAWKELLRFRELLGEAYCNKPRDEDYCLILYKQLLSWTPESHLVQI